MNTLKEVQVKSKDVSSQEAATIIQAKHDSLDFIMIALDGVKTGLIMNVFKRQSQQDILSHWMLGK